MYERSSLPKNGLYFVGVLSVVGVVMKTIVPDYSMHPRSLEYRWIKRYATMKPVTGVE